MRERDKPMKAMVFAAGLGTRLRPLTDDRPKALVEINGRTLLEITLARLRAFGVSDVIVNVFHFADMIAAYLEANNNFGLHIEVSREEVLLDTGGGLKKAAHFFVGNPSGGEDSFIVHNVDILSNIDLHRMLEFHSANRALATLAVQERHTSRYLLFDDQLQLCGRRAGNDPETQLVRPAKHFQPFAFSGIHILSPRLLTMLTEGGAFSIIDSYLRLTAGGEKVLAFRADQSYWRDLGKPDSVAQAAHDLDQNIIVP